MLPSQGFFNYNSCPYFASGLCERPNCLFRHEKNEKYSGHSAVHEVKHTSGHISKTKSTEETSNIKFKQNSICNFNSTKYLPTNMPKRPPKQSKTITKPTINFQNSNSSTFKCNVRPLNRKKDFSAKEMGTIAQTNTKGQQRVAHAPNKATFKSTMPVITAEAAAINTKVPLVYRQRTLLQMHKECLKCFSESVAVKTAEKEEADVARRCSSKMLYFSVATSVITRLRKGQPKKSPPSQSLVSVTRKPTSSTGPNWSIDSHNKKSPTLPVGTKLFQCLKQFLLTKDELQLHGYPLPHPSGEYGKAVSKSPRQKPIHKPIIKNGIADLTRRYCERCGKAYRTFSTGMPIIAEKCVYHYGRRFNKKTKGLLELRYTCCDGEATSEGCSVASSHISTAPGYEDNLTGFVRPLKEPGDDQIMGSSRWDMIALDCEMVYTTVGSELARVTVVDCQKNTLYDTLVKPFNAVLDYNSRFSGITKEMMEKGPSVSLIQVQAVLLTHLKPNSILIGHSLESDLHALRLIHCSVIDTSVLFPHRLGLPYKRSLRNLTGEYCRQIIQSSEDGHDSTEDALAALELVFYKLKMSSKML